MTRIRTLFCVALTLVLGACASSPPVQYFSLDDGQPRDVGSPSGLRVAVTQVDLPEAVDRPQLVIRTAGYQLRLDDQYEWVEPLRRQIPRVIARDLGEALDSGRVVALEMDGQDFDLDFKVMLDVQRLEVTSGQGVDLDVVWRVEPRDGKSFIGRSVVRQPIETTREPGDYQALVAAERCAFQRVAAQIASAITHWSKDTAADGFQAHRDTASGGPQGGKGRRHGI